MKLCLAGTYNVKKYKDIVYDTPYVLESFWYFEEWQVPLIKKCDLFLLDSGAFTMFTSGHKLSEKDWDNYLTSYINFINKYDVKHFFELDVDRIVGIKKVEEFRERLERETKKKCIPVWHIERGWKYFEKMCEEYDYVAIGGIAKNPNGKNIEKMFDYFITYAHSKGVKIHGLGYTSIDGLRKHHFDSVDSTSWNGVRFGSISKYENGRIKNVRINGKRIANIYEAMKYSYLEWRKFQDYADKYF